MACSTNKQLLTVANWMLKNARLVLTGSPSAMTQRPEFDSDGIWVCPPKVEMYQWLHHAAPNGHLGEFSSDLRKVSFALADFGKVVLDKLAMSDDICKEIPDDALFTFALHYQGNGGHFVQWMGNAPNVSWVMTYTQADGEDVRLTWHPSSQGAMSIPVRASGRTFLDPKKVGISAAKASVFGGTGWQGSSSTTTHIDSNSATGVLFGKADYTSRDSGGASSTDIPRASGAAQRLRPVVTWSDDIGSHTCASGSGDKTIDSCYETFYSKSKDEQGDKQADKKADKQGNTWSGNWGGTWGGTWSDTWNDKWGDKHGDK